MSPCKIFGQPLWESIGGGVDNFVLDITYDSISNQLHLCGFFKFAGGIEVNQTTSWDGHSWNLLGQGAGFSDSCQLQNCSDLHWIVPYNSEVIVGGTIGVFDSVWRISNLNRFDGTNWLPFGFPNSASVPIKCNNRLFVGGDELTEIGGLPVNNLAIWNDSTWEAFGGPLDFEGGYLITAEYYQGQYHFAGNFRHNTALKEIIKWDGLQWQPLAEGIKGLGAAVNRIKNYQGLLYVGGEFNWAEDNADDYLMAWDGYQWLETFPEVQYVSQVNELEVIDGKLYIVGQHHVFKDGVWNGPYNLAHYDGIEFCSFGGPYFQVEDIAGLNGEIYISTNPATSPGALQFFAKYIGTSQDEICIAQSTPNGTNTPSAKLLSIYPNPTGGQVNVSYLASEIGPIHISLFDPHGRRVQTWNFETSTLGINVFHLDLNAVAKGLYSLQLKSGDHLDQIKLVRQ
jgi:hypothetical protein